MRTLAERTPGFSGADLGNLVNEAAILSVRRGKKQIGMDELKEAIEKVILGPERKSKVINKKEKEIVAYHEAGHAIVATSLPNADPVQKVSIISRGQAGGDITTGASSDLERATRIARSLVTRYGMSDLGARTFGKKEDLIFLGREINEEKDYSEQTAQKIDAEVSRFVEEAYDKAKEIITEKKELMQKLAQVLLEKETVEKEEYDVIMGISEIKERKQEIQ
jgi:cell division protease FtsH